MNQKSLTVSAADPCRLRMSRDLFRPASLARLQQSQLRSLSSANRAEEVFCWWTPAKILKFRFSSQQSEVNKNIIFAKIHLFCSWITFNFSGYPTLTPRIHFDVKKLYVRSFILFNFQIMLGEKFSCFRYCSEVACARMILEFKLFVAVNVSHEWAFALHQLSRDVCSWWYENCLDMTIWSFETFFSVCFKCKTVTGCRFAAINHHILKRKTQLESFSFNILMSFILVSHISVKIIIIHHHHVP